MLDINHCYATQKNTLISVYKFVLPCIVYDYDSLFIVTLVYLY